MSDLLEDLSTLTTVSKGTFNKLLKHSRYCICHSVEESLLKNENITEIDIGIGTLYISVEENQVRYKFIPSMSLEDAVKWTVSNNRSPLVSEVESTLKDRITNVYKELL